MTTSGSQGRALVVGMGISGIATAARLRQAGWTPVLVEKAPARRSGGYFVALFGTGHAAARRLGILDHLHDRSSTSPGLDLDRSGRRFPGLTFANTPGAPWMVLRGDVERAAFATLPPDVEVRFSTTPTAIDQDADGVRVTLLDTASGVEATERFDLVVGADGLRSTVRRLVFGPDEDHLRRLNYMVAAFQLSKPPTGLRDGQNATLLEPDRAMTLFAFSDHEPTVLLSYRTDDVDAEFAAPPGERLRAAFGPEPLGDTLSEVIEAFETCDDALFDSAEQVHMDRWSKGRVVLVGDAAWCVTLYAGMGISSGLSAAEVLGIALEGHPDDLPAALDEWERTLRPHIAEYQRSAHDLRMIFVPDNRRQILQRRVLSFALRWPAALRLLGRLGLFAGPGGTAKEVDIAGLMDAGTAAGAPRTSGVVAA